MPLLLVDTNGTVHTYELIVELICGVDHCDREDFDQEEEVAGEEQQAQQEQLDGQVTEDTVDSGPSEESSNEGTSSSSLPTNAEKSIEEREKELAELLSTFTFKVRLEESDEEQRPVEVELQLSHVNKDGTFTINSNVLLQNEMLS